MIDDGGLMIVDGYEFNLMKKYHYLCAEMKAKHQDEEDYSFWTKYKRFASNELLLYIIMVVGILVGILIFS